MQQASKKHLSITSGLVSGSGMSIVQLLFLLCSISFVLSIPTLVLLGSLSMWVILFVFTGSFSARRGGRGWQAGFWSGLSGGVLTTIGLGMLLSWAFYPTNVFNIFMPYFFLLTVIFVLLGALFGAMGGFIDQGTSRPDPDEQSSKKTVISHPVTGKSGREVYPRRVQAGEIQVSEKTLLDN